METRETNEGKFRLAMKRSDKNLQFAPWIEGMFEIKKQSLRCQSKNIFINLNDCKVQKLESLHTGNNSKFVFSITTKNEEILFSAFDEESQQKSMQLIEKASKNADWERSSYEAIPRLGISLNYLLQLVRVEGLSFSMKTTSEVCKTIILKRTKSAQCSYCDYLLQIGSSEVGDATVFVSHGWDCNFNKVIQTLADRFSSSSEPVYFWFDIFSNNQHKTTDYDFTWWSTTFKQSIASFKHTVVVLDCWEDPFPLKRAWCIWEIYCTITSDAKLELLLSNEEKNVVQEIICYHPMVDVISRLLSKIDTSKCAATKKSDLAHIYYHIKTDVGFEKIDSMLKELFHKWWPTFLEETFQNAREENKWTAMGRILSYGKNFNQDISFFKGLFKKFKELIPSPSPLYFPLIEETIHFLRYIKSTSLISEWINYVKDNFGQYHAERKMEALQHLLWYIGCFKEKQEILISIAMTFPEFSSNISEELDNQIVQGHIPKTLIISHCNELVKIFNISEPALYERNINVFKKMFICCRNEPEFYRYFTSQCINFSKQGKDISLLLGVFTEYFSIPQGCLQSLVEFFEEMKFQRLFNDICVIKLRIECLRKIENDLNNMYLLAKDTFFSDENLLFAIKERRKLRDTLMTELLTTLSVEGNTDSLQSFEEFDQWIGFWHKNIAEDNLFEKQSIGIARIYYFYSKCRRSNSQQSDFLGLFLHFLDRCREFIQVNRSCPDFLSDEILRTISSVDDYIHPLLESHFDKLFEVIETLNVVELMIRWGQNLKLRGKFIPAERFLYQSIEKLRLTSFPQDQQKEWLSILQSLAGVYHNTQQYDLTIPLYEEIHDLSKSHQSLRNLVIVHYLHGNRTRYEELLEIHGKQYEYLKIKFNLYS